MRLWPLCLLLLACSDGDKDPAPGGGGGASGGAGAASTAPQGAARYSIGSAPTGALCTTKVKNLGFGKIDGAAVTAVVDGEGGVSVVCKVVPDGEGFVFEGTIKAGDDSFQASGTVTPGKPSTLDVTAVSAASGSTFSSVISPRCSVTVAPTDADPQLSVAAGQLWARFECPEVVRNGGFNNEPRCSVESGAYLSFSHCAAQ